MAPPFVSHILRAMVPERTKIALLMLAFLGTLLLSSCGILDRVFEADIPATSTTSPEEGEAEGSSEAGEGETLEVDATPTTPASRDFTVWLVTDIPGISQIQEQIIRFQIDQPDLDLEIEQKIASGPGSIQSYMQAAPSVAADIIPDLALIPAFLLPELADAGQVFPLEGVLTPEEIGDLFPPAMTAATVDSQIFGYPQALAGHLHLATNPTVVTRTLPSSWETFISLPISFTVPASSQEGAQFLLQLYQAEGGSLTDETGLPQLENGPLETALTLLQTALDREVLTGGSAGLLTLNETWSRLQTGSTAVILTSSQAYRERISQGETPGFAPLPGPDGPLAPNLRGWVWVITTPDVERQQQAADLISWMTSPNNLGSWSTRNRTLPARRSAFEQWPADRYTDFLIAELERANFDRRPGGGSQNEALATALQSLFTSDRANLPIQTIAETAAAAIP